MTERFCASHPWKSGFCGFRGSGSQKGNPSTRGQRKSTTKISLLSGHFVLFLPRDLVARKGTIILAKIIDPNHQEEGREEYNWHSGDPFGCFLTLLCQILVVKRPWPEKSTVTRDSGLRNVGLVPTIREVSETKRVVNWRWRKFSLGHGRWGNGVTAPAEMVETTVYPQKAHQNV